LRRPADRVRELAGRRPVAGGTGRAARAARILGRRANADVVEALVAAVLVDEAVVRRKADRRVGELGAGVAVDAAALAVEAIEAPLLPAGQRAAVAGHELVEGRLIGNQRRLVG